MQVWNSRQGKRKEEERKIVHQSHIVCHLLTCTSPFDRAWCAALIAITDADVLLSCHTRQSLLVF